jgi:hypothetical protein
MGYSASLFRHKASLAHPISVDSYWFPFSVDGSLYEKNVLKDISSKKVTVGFIGASFNSSKDLYQNRIAAMKYLGKKNFLTQPRMINRKKFNREILTGEKYIKFLTNNMFNLTCGGTCKYMTAKYFQIPASESLLICSDTIGLELFPENTYIKYDTSKESLDNMFSQIKYYLKNKKELEFKIKILKNYVLKEHSHKRRAKGLVKLFERYL